MYFCVSDVTLGESTCVLAHHDVPTRGIRARTGSMLVIQSPLLTGHTILGEIAILFACVNVFGGFVVTHRMLVMFVPSGGGDDDDDAGERSPKAKTH